MVKVSVEYTGDLHCSAVHEPSRAQLGTDAPVDNQGRGESFSPTDLVATALGTCMATTMAIYGQKHGIELKGMKIEVAKEMSADAPRRIARLTIHIRMPFAKTDRSAALENAALTCPVHRSLHADVEKPILFHWPEK